MRYIIEVSEITHHEKEVSKGEKRVKETEVRKLASIITHADDDLIAVKQVAATKRNEYIHLLRDSKVLQYRILQKDNQEATWEGITEGELV